MRLRSKQIFLAALAAAAVGCSGTSSTTPAVSDPTPGAKDVGTVTFRATFPAQPVDPSLISTAAATIAVKWEPYFGATTAQNYGTATLSRANPTYTVKLPIGLFYFTAIARDAGAVVLEAAGTGGKVIGGDNAIAITFLNGKWLFTTPIEILSQKNDASGPLVIDGFYLYGNDPNNIRKNALDPGVPQLENDYHGTWITNDSLNPNKQADLQVRTQFGGGAFNPSTLEGLGFNLTQNCGETYNGPSTCNTGPGGGLNERNIRLWSGGNGGGRSDSAYRRLLPSNMSSSPLGQAQETRIVDGTTIAGTLLEYVFVAGTTSFVRNQGPLVQGSSLGEVVSAAQSTNTAFTNLVVTEAREVIACQDGYNGGIVDGVVQMGTWDFRDTCCPSGGPCAPCGPSSAVYDAAGKFLYAERGNYNWSGPGDPGECNWGLVLPAGSTNRGELCPWFDYNTGTCMGGTTNVVVQPWDFHDLNGDGFISTGDYYFAHYLMTSFTINGWAYPFTAKGSLVTQSLSVQIQ
jgi:hypothetical protein